MDFNAFWVVVFLVLCYEQSSIANNVNVLDKNHPGRSRPKKSANSEVYLALPPENTKTGKQNSPPTLIRLDPNAPNRFKGKFPTPIERFIQRIQNYFSVYNPPEYLNELRPGIDNSEDSGDQADYSNETQIIFPCNGTSTIVIIPVALENENVSSEQNTNPDKPSVYGAPPPSKPNHLDYGVQTPAPYSVYGAPPPSKPNHLDYGVQTPAPYSVYGAPPPSKPNHLGYGVQTPASYPDSTTHKQNYLDTATPKPTCHDKVNTKCPDVTKPTPTPCAEETTTPKPKCPEVTTPTPGPCAEETTTPKPKCPEVTTPTPGPCAEETTTPKPKCPEVTTPTPPPCAEETTTPKPKCPEVTKPTPTPCAEETTTLKPKCPGQTAQKPLSSTRYNTTSSDFKPVSGYGPNEVPPLNLVARPVIGSTVVYFYKNPSTLPPNPPAYYMPSTQSPYEGPTRRPQPPILRLKQLLFPRLYAAFHGED